ncbi:MAG: alpha/beta hydrolase [Actinomycetota bacterium]|nr:alpha/beta hydrolase [Actinomycetota bacterium]
MTEQPSAVSATVAIGAGAGAGAVATVAVNGVQLQVHSAGDPENPTVVLCHGFPELAYSWRHQLPALAAAGYHVVAPDQRGYGHSSAPTDVAAYGVQHLTGDLFALLDHYGKDDAIFVGHDWGALLVWEAARLQPQRVRAVVAVSVPYVEWPGPPTQLMRMVYGDRFFYILYFQQVGPAEAELGADPAHSLAKFLYSASGIASAGRQMPALLPPMEGTGFLTMMPEPPPLPYTGPEGPWLTAADLQVYAAEFTHSGFFGPVSWYRNLDANAALVTGLGADRLAMPSWFITGEHDLVRLMDPHGVQRMQQQLPDFRGHTVVPGAGHWVQQEAPQAFNAALRGYLDSLR